MQLGKASAYAIFATLHLAKHGHDQPVQSRAIAEGCDIPVDYLHKILQDLVRARIIHSERGRHGGFRLVRTPAQTTLLDIVEAVDGPFVCKLETPTNTDQAAGAMNEIESIYDHIAAHSRSLLEETNLTQLLNE